MTSVGYDSIGVVAGNLNVDDGCLAAVIGGPYVAIAALEGGGYCVRAAWVVLWFEASWAHASFDCSSIAVYAAPEIRHEACYRPWAAAGGPAASGSNCCSP